MQFRTWGACGALVLGLVITWGGAARAQDAATPGEVRLAPGSNGALGAWLVSGPFERMRLPDEAGRSRRPPTRRSI